MKSFLAAIAASFVTFTRIPFPWTLPESAFKQASWHLPLIAWIFVLGLAVLHALFAKIIPNDLLLLLSLALPTVLSGAMHEDGLADSADGLFGGSSIEKRLAIMKDPRVGSFGVLALIFVLVGQVLALRAAPLEKQLLILAITLPLSRGLSLALLAALPYVQSPESRAHAYIAPQRTGFLWTLLWTLPVFLLYPEAAPWIFSFALGLFLAFAAFFHAKLKGVTGDCLGAAVKVSELAFLWLLAILTQHG